MDISALIEQGDPVHDAIRRGGLEAMKQHIRAGKSMVSWKDGKIVRIPPEELKKMLAEAEQSERHQSIRIRNVTRSKAHFLLKFIG